jgi:nucleolar protein 14
MQGEAEDSDEEGGKNKKKKGSAQDDDDDEDDEFGLGSGIKIRPTMADLGIDDEDDFIIDDDLVASGSEMDASESEESDDSEVEADEEEDDEFTKGLLTQEESGRPEFLTGANAPVQEIELPADNGVHGNLAYKFSCPQSHEELLEVTKGIDNLDLPIVVQRIRALHHPKLKSENKEKLGNFAVALVDHLSYLANQEDRPPFAILETLTRHVHSLANSFPVAIANAFRRHLKDLDTSRALSPTPGDLVILTAIGAIFPTSDHFHQVVTPAILCMGRYLGLKIPQTLSDYVTGAYLCTLCLQYQKLSKRYVPEVLNFVENTLCCLAPTKFTKAPGNFPLHEPKTSLRIKSTAGTSRRLTFYDCVNQDRSEAEDESLKAALLDINLSLLGQAAEIWSEKSSFTEVFVPALSIVQHYSGKMCRSHLSSSTQVSHYSVSYFNKLTYLEIRRQACPKAQPLTLTSTSLSTMA